MVKVPKIWLKKLKWLTFLAVFFYATYNFTNWFTGLRSDVREIVFAWEHHIPLLAWTIIPYWTENFFYGLSILLTRNIKELNTLGKRLFSVQLICVAGFLLVPLKQTFVRPNIDGFFGWWFNSLTNFDAPYNEAPSLHIALIIILLDFYLSRFSKKWHPVMIAFGVLIGISVLTTWQHHFIDVPSGMLAGALAVWLFPQDQNSPLIRKTWQLNWRWFSLYLGLSVITGYIGIAYQGIFYWLLYPSFTFFMVAINYLISGKDGFEKNKNGNYTFSVWIIFFPYFIIAYLNSKIWTRKANNYDEIIAGLFLGGYPNKSIACDSKFRSILDCTAELPFIWKIKHYISFPLLDMTPITADDCINGAKVIDDSMNKGNTLVFCALGYSRSATLVISFLIQHRKMSLEDAVNLVKEKRKGIVISTQQFDILATLA